MKFDQTAPGGGIEAACRPENGKLILEWSFHCTEETRNRIDKDNETFAWEGGGQTDRKNGKYVRFRMLDTQGDIALEGWQSLREEEPLQSVLLAPRLWRGTADSYLYHMEAVLLEEDGKCLDRIERSLPLRYLSSVDIGGKRELLLNGEAFAPKMVIYCLPDNAAGARGQGKIMEDLRQMLILGANCVCVEAACAERKELERLFLPLCDRLGFLVFLKSYEESGVVRVWEGNGSTQMSWPEEVPVFRGEEGCLFLSGRKSPESLFYKYRAKWSREPFVHIAAESVQRLESGNFTVRCYSNCDRVALYADGTLFEFQRGEEEFVFLEVPSRSPSIMLTAEGNGCSEALSIHKVFCSK